MISISFRTRARSRRCMSVLTISGLLGALSSTGLAQNAPSDTGPATANRPAVVPHPRAMFGAQPGVTKSKRPAHPNDLLSEFQKALALPPQDIPIAPFVGNATAVLATPGNGLILLRLPNCSLSAGNVPYSLTVSDPYGAPVSETLNYDQLLHSEAGLTTTGGDFNGKCPDPTIGINASAILYVGSSTTGMQMSAVAGYNSQVNSNVLYTFVIQANGTFV